MLIANELFHSKPRGSKVKKIQTFEEMNLSTDFVCFGINTGIIN